MSSAVVLAFLATVPAFQADTSFLVAGAESEATLTLQLPAEWLAQSPTVSVTANTGTLSAAPPAGDGAFRYTLRPPKARYPQVALVLAEVTVGERRELLWLSVPVHGTETLNLKTKALAQVQVSVASRTFGPARADAAGRVAVPVEVPPGVRTATIRSVDRVGNATKKRIDLEPPPFTRVHAVDVSGRASTGAAQSLELEIFQVRPDGAPDPTLPTVTSSAGKVGRAQRVRPGVFRVHFEAPPTAGEVSLRVSPKDPRAPAHVLVVRVVPGPPAAARLLLATDTFQVGGPTDVPVRIELRDAFGNPTPVPPDTKLVTDFGTIERTDDEVVALWRLSNALTGRTTATAALELDAMRAEAALRLVPGPPAVAELALSRSWARAGVDTVEGEIRVRDLAGNLILPTSLSASGNAGRAELAVDADAGHFRVRYAVPKHAQTGPDRLEVRMTPADGASAASASGSAPATLGSAPLWVLPYQPRWQLSLGLIALGQHNFTAGAAGAAIEAGLTPARGPVRVFTRVGGSAAQDVTVAHQQAGVRVRHRALTGTLGVRYSHTVSARVVVHGSLEAGAQHNRLELDLQHAVAGQTRSAPVWSWVARAGGGLSTPLGPGRLLGEVAWSHSPIEQPIRGSVGGLGVATGYLWELR